MKRIYISKIWKNLSVRQRGIVVISIPITCMAVSLPIVSWSHFDLIEDETAFDRLAIIRTVSKNILQTTANAQWGVQSYVLTEHKPFLRSYDRAMVDVPQQIANLPASVTDNLRQQKKLLVIERFSEEHLAELQKILAKASKTGTLPPQELDRWLIQNDSAIAELHQHIENFAQEEYETLIVNRQHLQEHQDRGFLLVVLFVATGILASFIAIKLFFNLDQELALQQAELKQLNQQLQSSNEQLKRFTANASHQLRGPLAAILSNAQMGLLTPDTDIPKIRQRLNKIVSLTKSNHNLVNSLLSLARLEVMTGVEDARQIDLVELLQQICDHFQESIAELDELDLKFTYLLPAISIYCLAESALIAQVIENLLDNARKYTPPGGAIHLQLLASSTIATIQITDNGKGIEAENLDTIFERFYRVESSNKDKQKGFGLGLAIAKQIIKLHQGNIYASSNSDRGSTFTIELPTSR